MSDIDDIKGPMTRPSDTEAVTLTEQIAELLAEHDRRYWFGSQAFKHGAKRGWFCNCDEFMALGESKAIEAHCAHVASVLAARLAGAGAQVTEAAVEAAAEAALTAAVPHLGDGPAEDDAARDAVYFAGFNAGMSHMGTGQAEADEDGAKP